MQSDRSEAVTRLRRQLAPLRGLWNGFEADLAAMGVSSLDQMRGRSADGLVREYCRRTHRPLDFVLAPYFEAVIRFSETGRAIPWWNIMRDGAEREGDRVGGAALK